MEASVGGTYIACDCTGGGYVRCSEVNGVGNEKAASTDSRSSGRLVKFRASDVGPASSFFADGFAQTFELATANVLKLNAIWASGRRSVEIDRHSIAPPD